MRVLPEDIHNQLITKIRILETRRRNNIMSTETMLLKPFIELILIGVMANMRIMIMKQRIKGMLIGNRRLVKMANKLEVVKLISELHQSSVIKEETRESGLIHLVLQSQDMR
jgi:hypothetical protein